jgi:glycogen debranching enzyme
VKRAVEGLLANNVDALGFITHDDADTWMDAKEKGLRAWSPRGNRAIDVQALWLDAFAAIMQMSEWAGAGKGSYQMPNSWGDDNAPKMEFLGPDAAFLEQVYHASKKLTLAIPTHFIDPATGNVADHLKVSGERNMQVRPNLFMAMMQVRTDMVPNASQSDKDAHAQMRWTRQLWEQLVYPWGVATLSQDDPDFYPYHEHWHYYHKDAAYHNGTVWPWLNGDAIERMVQFGQIDLAWQLFENMNRQALIEGAVGSLAECADALPVEGANWTRRTGTFLQAWSNGEHLRVWHRSFLGITASPMTGNIMIRPALPDRIRDVKDTIHYGRGSIEGAWNVGGPGRWTFAFSNVRGRLIFYHPDFPHNGLHADVVSGHRVEIVQSGVEITLTHFNRNGKIVATDSAFSMAHDSPGVAPSAQKVLWRQERVARDAIFAGLDFCKPRLQQGLKSLSVYHDPPLTY